MSEFWVGNSGISATPADVTRAYAANSYASKMLDSAARTPVEVAHLMRLSTRAVLDFSSDRKLYTYTVDEEVLFPDWQFNAAGDSAIPGLAEVLAAMPEDLHPLSVAGFFLTRQHDLVLDDEPVSAKAWLEAGRPVASVVALTDSFWCE